MNDFQAPGPSKGMPSWSDGVTLSYGEDGVRLTRHRRKVRFHQEDARGEDSGDTKGFRGSY